MQPKRSKGNNGSGLASDSDEYKAVTAAKDTALREMDEEITQLNTRVDSWRKAAEARRFPKILIVDDDIGNAEMIAEDLREHLSVDTSVAGTFDAADALLDQKAFAIVLLDVNLRDSRGRTGLDLVDRVRNRSATRPIPRIVLISGSVEALDRLAALSGASAMLQKPFGTKELIRTVAILLRK